MVLKLFKTSLPILFLTMIALLWTGCSNRQSPTQDIVELERLCSDYSHAGLFQKNDSVAALLYNYATETGDSMLMAKSLYYLGVYNMIPKTAELRYKRLLHCEKLLQTYPNDTLLLKVYNALGIYEAKYYQRFAKSANYITKSWKMAQKLGDEHKAMVAEQNLSAIMVYLDDTLGLKYDLNIFQYAKEKNDTALLLASAVHCGLYYSSKHFNKEKALYYASFLKGTTKSSRYAEILGNVESTQKNYKKAEQYYRMSFTAPDGSNNYTAWHYYALMLYKAGRFQESLKAAEKSDQIYRSLGSYGKDASNSLLYANNYHALGKEDEAYRWMKQYSEELDSVWRSLHRETIDRYHIQYETGKKDQEIQLEKLRVKNLWGIMILIVVCSLLFSGVTILYYNYRKRMLLSIVRQNRNMLSLEKSASHHSTTSAEPITANTPSGNEEDDTPTTASEKKKAIANEKIDIIYEKIRQEVMEHQSFRNPQLSRELLCQLCECNHTYLTLVIKEKTGMSYPQFISSVRIHEALKMLSDPNCQSTIKDIAQNVGFLSDKSFFVAFKKQVGMSPSVYRSIAKQDLQNSQE